MPELPEVETVAQELRPQIVSHSIDAVWVFWERSIDRPNVPDFVAALRGATVMDVRRRGKFVILQLDAGQALLVHLRMTGKLLVLPREADPAAESHVRVQFRLEDGRWLLFSDTRKFGRLYLVEDVHEVVGDLGPEPLSPAFTPEMLAQMLASRRGRIKPLLLNQRFLAGLGNIYTDEALWRARVHPLRPANELAGEEVRRLHAAIVSVLREAIGEGGTSLEDNQYRRPDDSTGGYQTLLCVYGREDESCPRCGAVIERLVVGQRGTHICPECQQFSVQ